MATGKHVAYYRVSTAKQGRSGLGLEAQQAAVRAYLNGGQWELAGEVVEVESGKRDDNRPQLQEALRLCRATGAKLIVAKLDRLSRNMAFIANLMDAGVDFEACDNPHATRFTLHLYAAIAEHERTLISERTKAALAAAKARGVALGGHRGHVLPSHKAAQVSAKVRSASASAKAADVRVSIDQARANGASSLREIAAALNANGITTPRGGAWAASQVKRVIEAG